LLLQCCRLLRSVLWLLLLLLLLLLLAHTPNSQQAPLLPSLLCLHCQMWLAGHRQR
jgi:hypothetical protein